MKQRCSITVRGREHEWCFDFFADPQYLAEWRADGLEVHEVLNVVPVWVNQLGLTHVWCRVQDAWRWMRLW